MTSPPVPTAWIVALHERLTLVYGPRFALQYGNLDQDKVIASWAHELRYCSTASIKHALNNLPPHAPNAVQFRELCMTLPKPVPALALPRGGDKPSQSTLARLDAAVSGVLAADRDPRAWARRLREREQAGERLTLFQRNAWRQALGEAGSSPVMPQASNGAGCSDD